MLTLTASSRWRSLTLEAIREAEAKKPNTVVRCGCRRRLASVTLTSVGPLFASSWRVPALDGADVGAVVTDTDTGERFSIGPRGDRGLDPHAGHQTVEVFALLQLPAADDDYPALLVRCDHGDAVLDRVNLLEASRRSREIVVQVDQPLHDYRLPDPPWTVVPPTD